MKSKDVVVGKVYAVKVNGKIAPVRLESMREGYKTRTVHHAVRTLDSRSKPVGMVSTSPPAVRYTYAQRPSCVTS